MQILHNWFNSKENTTESYKLIKNCWERKFSLFLHNLFVFRFRWSKLRFNYFQYSPEKSFFCELSTVKLNTDLKEMQF
jgi:hypothetical protein